MDRQIWHQIRSAVRRVDRIVPRSGRRTTYTDALIARLHLWCVWHDRPRCFMRDRLHLGPLLRPRRLPSYSQFCRRLKSPRVLLLIEHAFHWLADAARQPREVRALDGKTLAVSENTRDPDARKGRGNGGFARGYKLHARCDSAGVLEAVAVTPLNVGETIVAGDVLLERLPQGSRVLADANYDSNALHEKIDALGGRLLTPLKGRARSKHRLRQMSAARRRTLNAWDADPQGCRRQLQDRNCIERTFANLSNFGGGLTHLPPWVRTLKRVRLWVLAKLVVYHARIRVRQTTA